MAGSEHNHGHYKCQINKGKQVVVHVKKNEGVRSVPFNDVELEYYVACLP